MTEKQHLTTTSAHAEGWLVSQTLCCQLNYWGILSITRFSHTLLIRTNPMFGAK